MVGWHVGWSWAFININASAVSAKVPDSWDVCFSYQNVAVRRAGTVRMYKEDIF